MTPPTDAEFEGEERRAPPAEACAPVGVVLSRRPGATRWAKWRWTVAALLPGAGPAEGRVLSEDAATGARDIHAATLELELHRAEVEGYKVSLAMKPPAVFVVLRPSADPMSDEAPAVHRVTASAYEAQDYIDGDGEVVEAAPAPEALLAWIEDFASGHWRDEPFKKRKRDRYEREAEEGRGDPRIRQAADVYRAPAALKPRRPGESGEGER